MNTPPSEGNEGTIDIFVLSGSSTETRLLEENLGQGGYRVTLFEESGDLFKALSEGNPNLLICDATSLGAIAYDTSRRIKAGEGTWMIPVLILTRTTGLGDLLAILDSNADNFIAYPTEPDYLLSFVSGMLSTPVERQTPELIKTQFKIQHDDTMYVITADRRKLLEFLLSSFETAVNISEDLSLAKEEGRELSDSFARLRLTNAEQSCSINALNESLREKEQAEQALGQELSQRKEELEDRKREISGLRNGIEESRARLAVAEERIVTMAEEHDGIVTGHRSRIEALSREVTGLSSELETKIADLESALRKLEAETTRSSTAEGTIAELVPQKEEAERALISLRQESEKIWSMLASEKDRVISAEQAIDRLRQEKNQAEEVSAREISELKASAADQDAEIDRLREKVREENSRATEAEEQLSLLAQEKEAGESSLRSAAATLEQELSALKGRHDALEAALQEEERKLRSVEGELELSVAERGKAEEEARVASAGCEEIKVLLTAAEEKMRSLDRMLGEIKGERDRSEEAFRSALQEIDLIRSELEAAQEKSALAASGLADLAAEKVRYEETIRDLSTRLEGLESTLAGAGEKEEALKAELAVAAASRDRSEERLRDLTGALQEAEAALTSGEETRRALEEKLGVSAAEKDRAEAGFRETVSSLAEARSALELAGREKTALEGDIAQKISELERTLSENQSTLQSLKEIRSALDFEKSRGMALERQLVTVIRDKEELAHSAGCVSDEVLTELSQSTAEMEEARRESQAAWARAHQLEGELAVEKRREEEAAGQIRSLRDELEKLRVSIESERRLWELAEAGLRTRILEQDRLGSELEKTAEHGKEREDEQRATIQALHADLEAAVAEKESLEQQLEAMSRDLAQARTALADEWEDHMNANEQVQSAFQESDQLKKAEERLDALSSELQQARAALADEWVDHMTAAERLAEADRRNAELSKIAGMARPQPLHRKDPEELRMIRDRDLPVTFRPAPPALGKIDIPPVHAVREPDIPKPVDEEEEISRALPDESGLSPDYEVSTTADLRLEDLFEDEPAPVTGLKNTTPAYDEEPDQEDPSASGRQGPEPANGSGPGEKAEIGEEEAEYEMPGTEPEEAGRGRGGSSGEAPEERSDETGSNLPASAIPAGGSFNRKDWFDIFAWARHAESLSPGQRKQILRMGRLVQRGRRLTPKQEDQILEMITLVQSLGYRFP